jgi:Cucumopine synthase C-terminal helical bundle domain
MTISTITQQLSSELDELTERMLNHEPQEIRTLRSGSLPHLAGSYGQYFTTWDLANGALRDYAINLYHLLRTASDQRVPVDAIMAVLRNLDPVYSTYLGYSGFFTLAERTAQIVNLTITNRSELIGVLSSFTRYVNRLNAWSFHYFPWHVGERYRYPETGTARPCPYSPSPTGVIPKPDPSASVRVKLSWEPINVTHADLAADLNEFVGMLPFTVLQDHAVVSGESMYAWVPLMSLAATPVTERICDAPVGRLRYSQSTGNKLVVQYGQTTETLRSPVLGQIAPANINTLGIVGKAVWESTFRTKEHIWLTVERAPDRC